VFIIRDLLTENEKYTIPESVMCYNGQSEELFNKLKWVGNTMLKVINNEGMEKLIDIGTDFTQEQYN
jgi:hypothetical protein